MKNSVLDNTAQPSGPVKSVKAPYSKPVLHVYGSVATLTKGRGGSNIDGANGSKDALPPGLIR